MAGSGTDEGGGLPSVISPNTDTPNRHCGAHPVLIVCVIAPVSALPRNRTRSRWLFPKRRVEFPFVIGDGLSGTLLRKRFGNGSRKFYCTAIMKRLILKNWRAKLISLLLATTLWYLIKKNVATTPSLSEPASGTTMTGRH